MPHAVAARLFRSHVIRKHPNILLVPTALVDLPGRPTQLFYPRAVLDVTNPKVLALMTENIAQMAMWYGKDLRFLVSGEYATFLAGPAFGSPGYLKVLRDSSYCAKLTFENCEDCRPGTNYSESARRAFQEYLRERFGGVVQRVRDRWGLLPGDLPSFEAVDPRRHHCVKRGGKVVNIQPVLDFIEYNGWLKGEIDVIQYTAGKRVRPESSFSILSFGSNGIEHGWLHSDMAATGQWYTTVEEYLKDGHLFRVANVARLSGKPAAFLMEPDVVARILAHLGLPTTAPAIARPRAPPQGSMFE